MTTGNFLYKLYLHGEYIGDATASQYVGMGKLVQYCGRIYRVIGWTSYCRGSILEVKLSSVIEADYILIKD